VVHLLVSFLILPRKRLKSEQSFRIADSLWRSVGVVLFLFGVCWCSKEGYAERIFAPFQNYPSFYEHPLSHPPGMPNFLQGFLTLTHNQATWGWSPVPRMKVRMHSFFLSSESQKNQLYALDATLNLKESRTRCSVNASMLCCMHSPSSNTDTISIISQSIYSSCSLGGKSCCARGFVSCWGELGLLMHYQQGSNTLLYCPSLHLQGEYISASKWTVGVSNRVVYLSHPETNTISIVCPRYQVEPYLKRQWKYGSWGGHLSWSSDELSALFSRWNIGIGCTFES